MKENSFVIQMALKHGIDFRDGFVVVGKGDRLEVYCSGNRVSTGLKAFSISKSLETGEDGQLIVSGSLTEKARFERDEGDQRVLGALGGYLGYELSKAP